MQSQITTTLKEKMHLLLSRLERKSCDFAIDGAWTADEYVWANLATVNLSTHQPRVRLFKRKEGHCLSNSNAMAKQAGKDPQHNSVKISAHSREK